MATRNAAEADRDRDVGDVGDPELVPVCRHGILGEVRENRPVVVAVGRCNEPPPRPHCQAVFLPSSVCMAVTRR